MRAEVVVVDGPDAVPVPDLVQLLRAALDGTGPALLPVPGGPAADRVLDAAGLDRPVPDGTALLLPTSGSTGTPKVVELPASALLAGARATHARVGPPGRWLLALPLTHVAGWQVLVRGLLAAPSEQVPVTLTPGPFTAAALVDALDDADPAPRWASLVPTQLARVLDDEPATRAAQALTVLLGGAAAPQRLLDRAAAAGVRVVTTYGSTETSGGCVYDGHPLDGVQVAVDGGRLRIGGEVVATGYRDGSPGFATRDGTRWFTTSDLARTGDGGRVEVLGRADDVVVTGGENVSPAAVERVLHGVAGVDAAVVVGVPDDEWGQVVVAVVAGSPVPDLDVLRTAVAERLGRAHAPRHLVVVDELPLLGIGKPDRRAAAALAARTLVR